MTIRTSASCGFLMAAAGLLAAGHAQAQAQTQTPDTTAPLRGDTVADRALPQSEAQGLPVSDKWRLYPSIDMAERYDSNIYAQPHGKVDDFITLVRPELLLSDLAQGGAGASLRVFGDLQYHADQTSEDSQDYGFEGQATTSPDRRLQFGANTGFAHQTQDRADPEEQVGVPRTTLDRYYGRGQVNFRSGQTRFGLSAEARRLDFLQSFNDDRDRKELVVRGEAALTRSSTQEFYLAPQWTRVRYDDKSDRFGFDRDRDDVTGHVGMKIDLDGIILGTAEAGVTNLSYRDPRFDDHLIATALVDIDWNITQLTTISLHAERAPQATIQSGSSVRVNSDATLSVAHELRRWLIVEVDGGYDHWDFTGSGRDDNVKTAGGKLTYLMNRYAHIVAEYTYSDRNSDFDLADFSRQQAMLSLTLAL